MKEATRRQRGVKEWDLFGGEFSQEWHSPTERGRVPVRLAGEVVEGLGGGRSTRRALDFQTIRSFYAGKRLFLSPFFPPSHLFPLPL